MPKIDVDATREALERIAHGGSDLDRPLKMDFFVAVPNESAGRIMTARVADLGFDRSLDQEDRRLDVLLHQGTGADIRHCGRD